MNLVCCSNGGANFVASAGDVMISQFRQDPSATTLEVRVSGGTNNALCPSGKVIKLYYTVMAVNYTKPVPFMVYSITILTIKAFFCHVGAY